MITAIRFVAADEKEGMTLGELKVFMEQVDNQHVGRDVTEVQIKVRTGWKGQIRAIKAELEHH